MTTEVIALAITIIVQIVVFSFGYGKITQIQSQWKELIGKLSDEICNLPCKRSESYLMDRGKVQEEIREVKEKIIRIENQLTMVQNSIMYLTSRVGEVESNTKGLNGGCRDK